MLLKKMKKNLFVSALALVVSAQMIAQENADTLSASDFNLQEIVVSAPVMQVTNSKQEMNHAELNRDNTGQNLPYLLSTSPSIVVTSDDGIGVGYTYFHIRVWSVPRIWK